MGNSNLRPVNLETPLLDREPMEIEFAGNMFSWGISMRETRIRRPKTSKPHWSTGNQWKSSSPETCFPEVSRYGKSESGAQKRRKPIGRPGTNGKSSLPETCFPKISRCGKHESGVQTPRNPIGRAGSNGSRSGVQTPRNPIGRQDPMEVEVAGKFLPILDWKNNWSPVFTSHIGGGLERVDTSINRTSREWRPGGAPTKD